MTTAHTPTKAKKKAFDVVPHPNRTWLNSGKLLTSPASARLSSSTAASKARMCLILNMRASCEIGSRVKRETFLRRWGAWDSGRVR